jgi:hypothetical protein
MILTHQKLFPGSQAIEPFSKLRCHIKPLEYFKVISQPTRDISQASSAWNKLFD